MKKDERLKQVEVTGQGSGKEDNPSKQLMESLIAAADFVAVVTFMAVVFGYVYGVSYVSTFLKTFSGFKGSPFTFYTYPDIVRIGIVNLFTVPDSLKFWLIILLFFIIRYGVLPRFLGFSRIIEKHRIATAITFLVLLLVIDSRFCISLGKYYGSKEAENVAAAASTLQPSYEEKPLIEKLAYPATFNMKSDKFKMNVSTETTQQNTVSVDGSYVPILQDVYVLAHTGGYWYFVQRRHALSVLPDDSVIRVETQRTLFPLIGNAQKELFFGTDIKARIRLALTNSTAGDIRWQPMVQGMPGEVISYYIYVENMGDKNIEDVTVIFDFGQNDKYFTLFNKARVYRGYRGNQSETVEASRTYSLATHSIPLSKSAGVFYVLQEKIKDDTPDSVIPVKATLTFKDKQGKAYSHSLLSQVYVTR